MASPVHYIMKISVAEKHVCERTIHLRPALYIIYIYRERKGVLVIMHAYTKQHCRIFL